VKWSIRYRLFVPLGLLLLGIVGISAWSALASARHAEERIARQVRGVTQTLAGANLSLTPRILDQMKGLSGAEYLYLHDDKPISTFHDANIAFPPEILTEPAEDGGIDRLGIPIEIEGQGYRCRRLRLQGGGNLFIFYPETSLNEAIRDAVRPSLFFGFVGGLAAVTLMLVIGQRLVNRIRDLERRTRQIAAGDFSPMPLPKQHDELRDLSQSVNEMAEQLAHLRETVQKTERLHLIGQLSSGLAHQLRNAVTGAKLAVQLHASECPLADTEALQVTLRQLTLMEANLRRFMDLGKEPGPRQRCSIPAIVEEVLSLLRPQSKHTGVELRFASNGKLVEIDGDAGQLRDALLNIIGNAIEAAGPNGCVEVALTHPDGSAFGVVVDVIDTGPGPPESIAAWLFEPLVTGKPEGIGLGLAVARRAVEAHRGTISWSRENGKTRFRIVLPARNE